MSELHTHTLDGCTPTPLAGYLKALGVLRLLANAPNTIKNEATDPAARGWWANERFHITTKLDRDALLRFFLEDYAPSPVIGPWNGRAGFLEGDAGEESNRTGATLMRSIETCEAKRLQNMRDVILTLRQEPELVKYDKARANFKAAKGEERKKFQKEVEDTKSFLLPSLRANAAPQHLAFIDACFVLADEEQAAPLLGSGGNDGSRDFGVNFAEALEALFDFGSGEAKPAAAIELESSLFAAANQLERTGAIGQYGPGQGGANASTGFDGENALNRWDVVLLLEGTLMFAGALTRRWGATSTGRAAFPFTFEPNRAGSGALSTEDSNAPRGEIWTPLWNKPTRFSEIETLLSEGRLTLGRSTARTGIEAARAVSTLGVSRGISAFDRYSLVQPDAKMPYQATPLGRYNTPDKPRRDLIADLDRGGWLSNLRRAAGKNAPARARMVIRQLDDALVAMTRIDIAQKDKTNPRAVQQALMAIGSVVSWLATSKEARENVLPPPQLGREWIEAADDKSAEFRVAVALAGLGWPETSAQKSEPASSDTARADERGETGRADDEDEAQEPSPASEKHKLTSEKSEPPKHAPPMAAHFAAIAENSIRRPLRTWEDTNSAETVWGAGGLPRNMIAVLERRLVNYAKRGLEDKPFGANSPARLADIAVFLQGPSFFDDTRCAALLAGLVWAEPAWLAPAKRADDLAVPFAYAAVKPLFMTNQDLRKPDEAKLAKLNKIDREILERQQFLSNGARLPIPPGLVTRIRRKNVNDAVLISLQRARASGLASPFLTTKKSTDNAFGRGVDAERLAAALLIPVSHRRMVDDHLIANVLTSLMNRAYPKSNKPGEPNTNTEEDDVA